MAMGIPLVCNYGVGDTDEIVKKYKAGSIITSVDSINYMSSLKYLPEVNRELMIEGAKEFFSLEEGIKKYLKVYKEICDYE